MGLFNQTNQEGMVSKRKTISTENVTLKASEQLVFYAPGDGDDDITLTLPPVAEAIGRIYVIAGAANIGDLTAALTVQDQDDSEDWSNKTLNVNSARLVLLSDGYHWCILESELS